MNQILCRDWLPEWSRWRYLDRSGLRAVSRKKKFPEAEAEAIYISFIDQACSAKIAGF